MCRRASSSERSGGRVCDGEEGMKEGEKETGAVLTCLLLLQRRDQVAASLPETLKGSQS